MAARRSDLVVQGRRKGSPARGPPADGAVGRFEEPAVAWRSHEDVTRAIDVTPRRQERTARNPPRPRRWAELEQARPTQTLSITGPAVRSGILICTMHWPVIDVELIAGTSCPSDRRSRNRSDRSWTCEEACRVDPPGPGELPPCRELWSAGVVDRDVQVAAVSTDAVAGDLGRERERVGARRGVGEEAEKEAVASR